MASCIAPIATGGLAASPLLVALLPLPLAGRLLALILPLLLVRNPFSAATLMRSILSERQGQGECICNTQSRQNSSAMCNSLMWQC
jgi:hypothetical protein